MILADLNILIQSLSNAERRMIEKSCGSNSLNRSYFKLFQYLTANPHKQLKEILQELSKTLPKVQIESAAQYLLKLISDQLVLCRVNQDDWYKQYFGIMKAKLFTERNLENRALIELSKVERLAESQQNNNSFYQASRMSLAIHTSKNFEGIDEQILVNKQMKIRTTLQHSKQLQDHLSLFELLSYRFSNQNIGEKKDKDLQDLLLNELSLSSLGSKLFEIQKTHLMFQSFFFIRSTEYNAALKIFYKLIALFQQNKHLWNNPPYDYLSTLDGILDALRSMRLYNEMNNFLNILQEITQENYTDHFDQQAKLTLLCYKFNMFIANHEIKNMNQLLVEVNQLGQIEKYSPSSMKFIELDFMLTVVYFLNGNLKLANKRYLNVNESINKNINLFRASRLLSIIILYEINEVYSLEHEIRSYKRYFSKFSGLLKTERLIFRFILSLGKSKSKYWKAAYGKTLSSSLEELKIEKREMELNKYYPFIDWLIKSLN